MHRAGIDFICSPELFGKMPEPQRANRFVPEWFRRLNRKMDGAAPGEEAKLTIKSCMPVTDVFALGYILPLAFDVTLDISPDRRTITTHVETDCPITMIEPHKPGQIGAPMPGAVLAVNVATGDDVKSGDKVAVLTAMKMETNVTAPIDGTVARILVAEGDEVAVGDLLLELD